MGGDYMRKVIAVTTSAALFVAAVIMAKRYIGEKYESGEWL